MLVCEKKNWVSILQVGERNVFSLVRIGSLWDNCNALSDVHV